MSFKTHEINGEKYFLWRQVASSTKWNTAPLSIFHVVVKTVNVFTWSRTDDQSAHRKKSACGGPLDHECNLLHVLSHSLSKKWPSSIVIEPLIPRPHFGKLPYCFATTPLDYDHDRRGHATKTGLLFDILSRLGGKFPPVRTYPHSNQYEYWWPSWRDSQSINSFLIS